MCKNQVISMPWKYKRLMAPAVAWTTVAAVITLLIIANNGSEWNNEGKTMKDRLVNYMQPSIKKRLAYGYKMIT